MADTNHALFPRYAAELVSTALNDTPVVMVTGPRQCGNTSACGVTRGAAPQAVPGVTVSKKEARRFYKSCRLSNFSAAK
jgi:hypothetical protein